MPIHIPAEKGRPVDCVQSAKLSNELGVLTRNLIRVPRKWKDISEDEKDLAYERLLVRILLYTFCFIFSSFSQYLIFIQF